MGKLVECSMPGILRVGRSREDDNTPNFSSSFSRFYLLYSLTHSRFTSVWLEMIEQNLQNAVVLSNIWNKTFSPFCATELYCKPKACSKEFFLKEKHFCFMISKLSDILFLVSATSIKFPIWEPLNVCCLLSFLSFEFRAGSY